MEEDDVTGNVRIRNYTMTCRALVLSFSPLWAASGPPLWYSDGLQTVAVCTFTKAVCIRTKISFLTSITLHYTLYNIGFMPLIA